MRHCHEAAEAASLRARAADDQALIAHLKLQIEKLRRERFGQRSERSARLLDQLELQLEELEASATEDELAAERAAARTTKVAAFTRQAASAQAVPRASAARARDRSRTDRLPLLRRRTPVEAGRGRDRDPGGHPPPVEGDPARAREVLVPGLREHQPGAGAVPRRAQRLGRPQPAGDDPVREVRPASATQPPGRALRPRGRTTEPLDSGRPGWHVLHGAAAAP